MDNIKRAAKAIREALLKADFDLQEKSCDAEKLKDLGLQQECLVSSYLSSLYWSISIKKTLPELYYNGDYSEDILIEELEDEKLPMKAAKIRSLFQMFYIFNGSQGIRLHIMKAAEVYKKCKNHNICELTTVFLKNGLCDCYITMKRHRSDLAKYAVVSGQGKERNVALSSYFPPSSFTVVGFDNFGYVDKNILLGNASAYYIAVTVFSGKTRQTFAKTVKE